MHNKRKGKKERKKLIQINKNQEACFKEAWSNDANAIKYFFKSWIARNCCTVFNFH